jgi:hypothetical protein
MKAFLFSAIGYCGLTFAIAWTAHAQDADQAAWLKHQVGQWKAELKLWPGGAESEPIVFEASETNEMLGDNWIIVNFKGEFGGQAFRGHGVVGFDSRNERFVATWVDSVNGFMSQYEGTYDASSKSVVLTGKELDPNNGDLVAGKQIRTIKDDNTRVVESYQKPEGSDEFTKVMEITFTRKSD